jgi:hypothetical protein
MFPTKIPQTPFFSPIRATCHAHRILLVFGECKPCSSAFCTLLPSLVTSSVLGPYVFPSTLFSKTLSLDQISQPWWHTNTCSYNPRRRDRSQILISAITNTDMNKYQWSECPILGFMYFCIILQYWSTAIHYCLQHPTIWRWVAWLYTKRIDTIFSYFGGLRTSYWQCNATTLWYKYNSNSTKHRNMLMWNVHKARNILTFDIVTNRLWCYHNTTNTQT